jgi:hypothetical protein
MTTQIERTFSHRTLGHVGQASLTVDKGKWALDGEPLPEPSVEHLMTFALQSLQDAYAGAASLEEAQAAFAKKRTRLLEGTVGTHSAASEEPHMPYVRRIIRTALTGDNKAAYDAIGSDDKKARTAFLNERFAGLDEKRQATVVASAQAALRADQEAKKVARSATGSLGL